MTGGPRPLWALNLEAKYADLAAAEGPLAADCEGCNAPAGTACYPHCLSWEALNR